MFVAFETAATTHPPSETIATAPARTIGKPPSSAAPSSAAAAAAPATTTASGDSDAAEESPSKRKRLGSIMVPFSDAKSCDSADAEDQILSSLIEQVLRNALGGYSTVPDIDGVWS